MNPLPSSVRSLLVAATVASAGLSFWYYIVRPPIRTIVCKAGGEWTLIFTDGTTCAGRLLGTTLATPWITLLHLRTDRGKRVVLICRDSLDHETYRLLIVSLTVNPQTAQFS